MSRSKTTSIPRPKEPAKASDDGRSRLGDFTRPIPVEKRLFRRPKVALFSGVFVLLVIGTLAAAVFILPLGTWFDQSDQLVQRQAELDELVARRRQLIALHVAEKTRLHQSQAKKVRKSVGHVLDLVRKELDAIDAELARLIEADDDWPFWAVQWHPETRVEIGLMAGLVEAARERDVRRGR